MDAVYIQAAKAQDALNPLGDVTDLNTGYNHFLNIGGYAVNKERPEAVMAQHCDWGAYTETRIALLVHGCVDCRFPPGAPFGIYLLSDLVAGHVPSAKVYFFANCYRLDARQREAVLRATRGKTAAWFYAGGFLSDTADDANMTQMVGLQLRRSAPESEKVTPEKAGQGLAAGLTATSAGQKRLLFPRACDVTNALDGQPVAQDVRQLDLDLALGETRLYLLP